MLVSTLIYRALLFLCPSGYRFVVVYCCYYLQHARQDGLDTSVTDNVIVMGHHANHGTLFPFVPAVVWLAGRGTRVKSVGISLSCLLVLSLFLFFLCFCGEGIYRGFIFFVFGVF